MEIQRISIGKAIISHPNIPLTDESVGNPDSAILKQIFGLFQNIDNQGIILIIVICNMELADNVHRIIKLKDGKTV